MRTASLVIASLVFSPCLAAQIAWTTRAPARAQAYPDASYAATDRTSGRVLILERYGVRTELWQLVGTKRTKLGAAPDHAVATGWDEKRRVLVVLTHVPNDPESDTWEWDGAKWTRAGERSELYFGHPLLFDASAQRVVALAEHPMDYTAWIYEYVSGRWVAREGSRTPDRMFGAQWAMDREGRALALAYHRWAGAYTIAYEHGTWNTLPSVNTPQAVLSVGFDEARRRFVLHGAQNDPYGGTYDFVGGKWQLRVRESASLRDGASLVFDGGSLLALGGTRDDSVRGKVYQDSILACSAVRPARAASFGASCSGAGVTPKLVPGFGPWLSADAELRIEGAATSSAFLLATGLSRKSWGSASLPFDLTAFGMPGCQVFASLDVVEASKRDIRYPIPAQPALVGLEYYQQALALLPSANAAGILWSNGVALRVGER